jgi:hypothetical protein
MPNCHRSQTKKDRDAVFPILPKFIRSVWVASTFTKKPPLGKSSSQWRLLRVRLLMGSDFQSKIQNPTNRFDAMPIFRSVLVSDTGITRDYRRH